MASTRTEREIRKQLATICAHACQRARRERRTTQERPTQMHRFHLRPDCYRSGLEARWDQLTNAP